MASKVSKERREELRELFNNFDVNKDGSLSAKEIQAALRTMGTVVSIEQAQKIVNDADDNGDGEMDFEEFVVVITKNEDSSGITKQDVIDTFKAFDKNGDGFLSNEELAATLKALGLSLSQKEIDEIVKDGDDNGDGVISLDEFLKMCLE